jgi:hypothetical protein
MYQQSPLERLITTFAPGVLLCLIIWGVCELGALLLDVSVTINLPW